MPTSTDGTIVTITGTTIDPTAIPFDATKLIAHGITTIGGSAFMGLKALVTVDCPNLTTIGTYAFSGCVALTTVNFTNLTDIRDYAFSYCAALTTVDFPTLTTIGSSAFESCVALTTVDFPNLTTIGTYAFSGCAALTTVNFTKLTNIGGFAFFNTAPNIIVSSTSSPIFTTTDALANFKGTIEFETHQDETEVDKLRNNFTGVTGWTNPPLSVSHSGGDPYVYPVVGPCYKLPNCGDIYRLYQDAHVVVNARVSVASPQIQAEIVDAVLAIGCDFMTPVSTEAYFYSQIMVASRTTDDQVLIDLEQKQHSVTGSTQMFRVGSPELLTDSRPYESTVKSHVGIPVRWGNDMCLTISFSRNPQVRNGVRLSGTFSTEAAGGLLVRNYRPKLFRLPDIHCTSLVSIPTRCTRPLTKRGIQGHRMLTVTT
jgi:hypothetical protein